MSAIHDKYNPRWKWILFGFLLHEFIVASLICIMKWMDK